MKTAYPNPDDTNPAARDTLDVGEAPVTVHSDDRRNKLRNAERTHESERRTLHEEEAVRTRDEDESLRDDGNLEVDDGVELRVVVVGRLARTTGEGRTECIGKPGRADDDRDEGDGRQREVETVRNGEREDLGQVPTVRSIRGEHTVNGERHDRAVVEEGNDQDHERREVELEREGEDSEADDDTDRDGVSVDDVVPHTLEDNARAANGMDDCRETRLSQDDIGS